MIWYVFKDVWYLQNIKSWWKRKGELLILPELSEVREKLRKGEVFDVMHNRYPFDEIKGLFVVRELPNKFGIYTTQEIEYLKELSLEEKVQYEKNKLEEMLGLRIHKPKLSEESLIGLNNVKQFLMRVKLVKDEKLRARGIFLVGVPGVGKSYSARYAASFLDWYLVEFNVAKLLEVENPTHTLHEVFNYLEEFSKGRDVAGVVLWIDEIEKMFAGFTSEEKAKRIFGQLLTILSDWNTEVGYKVNGIFWVTANNVLSIIEHNPEFLRRGRFDELFFVDTPTFEDVCKLVLLYKKEYEFEYEKGNEVLVVDFINCVKRVYGSAIEKYGSKDVSRFIYTPAEIQHIVKECCIRSKLKKEGVELRLLYGLKEFGKVREFIRWKDYEEFLGKHEEWLKRDVLQEVDLFFVIAKYDPITIVLRESIAYMRSQSEFFTMAD